MFYKSFLVQRKERNSEKWVTISSHWWVTTAFFHLKIYIIFLDIFTTRSYRIFEHETESTWYEININSNTNLGL